MQWTHWKMFYKMHFYSVFYIIFTFVRWKTCSSDILSKSLSDGISTVDELTTLPNSFQSSVTEYSAGTVIISPSPRYLTHDSNQIKNIYPASVARVTRLEKNPTQMELRFASGSSKTTAPDYTISSSMLAFEKTEPSRLVPLRKNKKSKRMSEIIANKLINTWSTHFNIPLTSSSQPVPSELFQTSHAETNLMPNAYPISARMLNISPDIITTSPINSHKDIYKKLEIHATPAVANPRMKSSNSSKISESNAFLERDIATMPNSTRPIFLGNGTKSVRVEKRSNSHTMVIVPAVIGVISVLSVGVMAAFYQWHQRGRRRKVYLSHPGVPPKDFAEDTGVRSPVLLPEEIEMQVGHSQSLRVRRAVILATDSPAVEADSITVNVESVMSVDSPTDPVTSSSPPPPPYREPPPYLPDMVIENIHAL